MRKKHISIAAMLSIASGVFILCAPTYLSAMGGDVVCKPMPRPALKQPEDPSVPRLISIQYAPFQIHFKQVAEDVMQIRKASVKMRFFLKQLNNVKALEAFKSTIDSTWNPRFVACPSDIADSPSQRCLAFDEPIAEKNVFLTDNDQRVLELLDVEWPWYLTRGSYGMVEEGQIVRFSYEGDPINVVGQRTRYVQTNTANLLDTDVIFQCN